MNASEKVKFISNWIKDYANNMPSKAESLVLGISGGIDSSVSSTLSAMTGLKTIVLSMPIKQKENQHDLSLKHQDWLVKKFKNVEAHIISLDNLTSEYFVNLFNKSDGGSDKLIFYFYWKICIFIWHFRLQGTNLHFLFNFRN